MSVGRRGKSGTGDSKPQVRLLNSGTFYFTVAIALSLRSVIHIQLKHSKQLWFCILRTKTLEMDES